MNGFLRIGMMALLVLTSGSLSMGAEGDSEKNRIKPYAENPHYWQYKGKPVLLLGGSVEDNLFQIPDLVPHLELLASVGGNYVRNTMSSRDPGNVQPFAKVEGKYDLERLNPEYWRRFETFLAETAKRDIIVQIEVWATFDYYRELWAGGPFNPRNNVNYTVEASRLPVEVNSHPVRAQNDFFRSVPGAKDLKVVRKHQERFVSEILAHSLRYDHVLYCMDNETAVGPEWGAYWATFIRQSAAKQGKQVEVTEMWDPWDIRHPKHQATIDHPETYTFIDVSQNNHQKGQAHYDNPQWLRARIKDHPRPINSIKIYGADGGRFGNSRDGIERFWRNIFGGLAAVRFHRPDSGIGLSEKAQRMIRSARTVTDAFDLFACEPRNDLLSDRQPNEAYCLANASGECVVYFPAEGQVAVKPIKQAGGWQARWFNIDAGAWSAARTVAGQTVALQTPGKGQWAAVVKPQ
ncbi:MAG: hypothetical protein JXQ73_33165 [Phycisphaerae bacterium]|nr:hypothetical protein [Phycisphaerae bacterium]